MTGPLSAAERLAALLRDELLSGKRPPGDRLKEEELARRFRTGRYTVRAALRILVDTGMLEHRANHGASVPMLDPQRVDELCDHREVLELGALRLAIRGGADLSAVTAATLELTRMTDDVPWTQVVLAHQRIHHELVAAAGNRKLLQAYSQCEDELLYVVSTVRPDYTASRLAHLHSRLLAGLRKGPDEAIRALERDLRIGRAAVLDALPITVRVRAGKARPAAEAEAPVDEVSAGE